MARLCGSRDDGQPIFHSPVGQDVVLQEGARLTFRYIQWTGEVDTELAVALYDRDQPPVDLVRVNVFEGTGSNLRGRNQPHGGWAAVDLSPYVARYAGRPVNLQIECNLLDRAGNRSARRPGLCDDVSSRRGGRPACLEHGSLQRRAYRCDARPWTARMSRVLSVDLTVFTRTFVAVFVMADALGNAPLFLVLTRRLEPRERAAVIDRAALVAVLVLLGFAFAGEAVLAYLHIRLASLKVAGGLLLLLVALDMLRGHMDAPVTEAGRDLAITPLALPLLAGPGTLTTVMILMSESPAARTSVVLGILSAMIVTWIIVRQAPLVDRLIGKSGATIATKLLGFLLAALAVEIGSGGIRELLSSAM
jgi:multiple antibiotic resistance protein